MQLKTDNPFDGWTHQVFGQMASDQYGREVPPEAGIAQGWCAVGWIAKTGLLDLIGGETLWREFNQWYYTKHGRSLIEDNDVHHKSPEWFRGQWNAFLDEPISVHIRERAKRRNLDAQPAK